MSAPIQTYADFWKFYLKEHSRPWTRRLHVLGTVLALSLAGVLAVRGLWAWLPVCLLVGYGFAWYSHFFIQHNRPATFRYPLWTFVSDFRMAFLYLTGRL